MSLRFRVALSFPGEKPSFVELVADRLAERGSMWLNLADAGI